jgi:hypothetical protein
MFRGGLEFDGVNDFVDITDVNGYPDAIGEISIGTISLWFKFDSEPVDDTIHPLFYLGDGIGGMGNSSINIEIGHFNTGNNKLYFTVITDDKYIPLCFDTGFNLDIGRWYHFAAVVDVNYNTGYLDGEELVNRHYNFGDSGGSYFLDDINDKRVCWLGKGFVGSRPAVNYHDGKIDEVRIYDRPLDAEEIGLYYKLSSGTFKVLDDTPKKVVVNGYSTSFDWPLKLQQKLDDYYGQRVIEVIDATKAGTPIAKWIDVETGTRLQNWTDILSPAFDQNEPVIVLAQQSLQWVFDPNDRHLGITGPNDVARIEEGAEGIETYVKALNEDGADMIIYATHIYKYSMEPEIENEKYALAEMLSRQRFAFEGGPDVWTPMRDAWPDAFKADQVHPNDVGAEIMADHWFEAILTRDGPWDLNTDKRINHVDFGIFAVNWGLANCQNINNWCGGADFDRNGAVDLYDLFRIGDNWLKLIGP